MTTLRRDGSLVHRNPDEIKDDALITAAYWVEHDFLAGLISTDAFVLRMKVLRKALGYDPLAGVQR